jgi:hypothetical protein
MAVTSDGPPSFALPGRESDLPRFRSNTPRVEACGKYMTVRFPLNPPERLQVSKNKPKKISRAQSRGAQPVQDAIDKSKSQELWMKIILGVFALALYANTLGHSFAFDDMVVVQGNRFTQQGFAGIPRILTTF